MGLLNACTKLTKLIEKLFSSFLNHCIQQNIDKLPVIEIIAPTMGSLAGKMTADWFWTMLKSLWANQCKIRCRLDKKRINFNPKL